MPAMNTARRGEAISTGLGILAILIWGSTIAALRSVVEQMGALAMGAAANLIGGGLACLVVLASPGRMGRLVRLPRAYLLGCGSLFVACNLTLYLAIHRSATREQTVEVALVNYLWPALTLVLTVPILHHRARPWLWPGLLLAVLGAGLGMSQGRAISWASVKDNVVSNPDPYVLALVSAVTWGLYSNLARRWAGDTRDSAAPLFLLATGLVLAAGRWLSGEPARWPADLRGMMELLYLACFPTMLAYLFWDVAARKGNIVLVSSASFFIPLLSTIISCVYLGVRMGADLWIAGGLVVVGAVVCKWSVIEPPSGVVPASAAGPPPACRALGLRSAGPAPRDRASALVADERDP